MNSKNLINLLKGIRPWSLPMTLFDYISVMIVSSIIFHRISLWLTIIGLIGSIILHIASNVFNDYFDFKKGIDSEKGMVRRFHLIIHKILSPDATLMFGYAMSAIAISLGLILTLEGRPLSIILGLIGFILAYGYSGFPLYLKYNALGELTAYLAWGVVIPLGAFYLATGRISYIPLIVGLPPSVYLFTVMNINNIRDIEYDRNAGAKTIAILLGKTKAKALFLIELFMPYAFICLGIFIFKILPITTIFANVTLIYNYFIIKNLIKDRLATLDVITAMQALFFGIFYSISIGVFKLF